MPVIGEIKKGKEINLGTNPSQSYIWHACIDCRKERWIIFLHGEARTKRCRSCASKLISHGQGPKNSKWKGGRVCDGRGYIKVWLDPDDFFYRMADTGGYVPDHRLVMARYLKRCLLPWEVVHHINGVKDDNRLENLELLPHQGKHNTMLNKRIKELERVIKQQAIEIKLLRFQFCELRNANTEKEAING